MVSTLLSGRGTCAQALKGDATAKIKIRNGLYWVVQSVCSVLNNNEYKADRPSQCKHKPALCIHMFIMTDMKLITVTRTFVVCAIFFTSDGTVLDECTWVCYKEPAPNMDFEKNF